ncbi:T9SS type A sorting domain-containing protein [Dyadobacter sp. CY323]|uniref:T9SS type A sorting domain-containing protein n=1 Tax=Dyadobacter sp. CY323 TaxID=2907302 RepID=UPI001F1B95F2|nr:T9SS type A sorting domain-containing protein [Dyadobacter sp. CY323]MCE6990595.1 T9SS type A sorting domain-containing protein [Dyadobacter sp. CY323]
MKAVFLQKLMLPLSLSAVLFVSNQASAQADKKTKPGDKSESVIRIQITEDEGGKTTNKERSYRVGAMSDDERDKFVEKVLDSLGVDKKKKQSISITVDDGDTDMIAAKKRRKVIIDHRDDREPLAYHWKNDHSFDFEWDSDKFRSNLREFERDIRPKTKMLLKDMEHLGTQMGDIWEKDFVKPANVRALSAYSNNPDNGMLNLRFSVPEKGDVTVTVTDTKGKEVGKKEIKDFEGEFVGQIELKKSTKGTLFVTVVQNEDGTVKRVVIP